MSHPDPQRAPVEWLLREHGIVLPAERIAEFRENHADLQDLVLVVRQAVAAGQEASE